MKSGRFLSFFLPTLTGLALVVSVPALSGSVLAKRSDENHNYISNPCYGQNSLNFLNIDAQATFNNYPTPTPCPTPTPTPTPDPCLTQEPIGFWNFPNVDVYASHTHYPKPSPCPSPTPTPEPTPTPTPFVPPVGGSNGGGGGDGAEAPSCPVDAKPQNIDQVWITDVTSTSLVVNWANKGDASGFQIAYGPQENKLQWGIRVNDGKANSYQINGIPENLKVFVSIAPVDGDCSGNPAEATTALASTGVVQSLSSLLGGFGLIALGLWQSQKTAFSKRFKKGSK